MLENADSQVDFAPRCQRRQPDPERDCQAFVFWPLVLRKWRFRRPRHSVARCLLSLTFAAHLSWLLGLLTFDSGGGPILRR